MKEESVFVEGVEMLLTERAREKWEVELLIPCIVFEVVLCWSHAPLVHYWNLRFACNTP